MLRWHLKAAIMAGERPDPARIRPFGRHAGSQYSQAGGFFNLTRPRWADLRGGSGTARARTAPGTSAGVKAGRAPLRAGSFASQYYLIIILI